VTHPVSKLQVVAKGRLVFLGSPPAAVPTLDALCIAGHEVALVVSQPDKRRGRGRDSFAPSPVKQRATELGLDVTDKLNDVLDVGADLCVVVAYGKIIPKRVLDVVPMINVHFSLLPRWRGAAPVERAILAGDRETGVCIMRLEAGLDTGPVLARRSTEIGSSETAQDLTARLASMGAELTAEVMSGGVSALGPGEPQVGEPTYAAKIDSDELKLEFDRGADELVRSVRIGRAWTIFRGHRLRVLVADFETEDSDDAVGPDPEYPGLLQGTNVKTGKGWLRLVEVQPEGKRPMAATDWIRGIHTEPGELLG
jgi:methionyl-tRNA formyltransferase